MNDNLDRAEIADRLMVRLSGFVRDIGMQATDARQILDRVIAEDLSAAEDDIVVKARAWMLIALA